LLGLDCMRRWDIALEEYLRTSYKEDIVNPPVSSRNPSEFGSERS
jgi:hypothetical protein